MAFCVSYGRVSNQHINHMFSTKEFVPAPQRTHRISYNPPILSYNLSQEKQQAWMKKRLYQFDPEYGTEVQRAPAFDVVSKSHLQSIISRLTRPSTLKAYPRMCRHYQAGFKRYKHEEKDGKEKNKKEPMTARDVKEMVARLSKPRNCLKRHHEMYQSAPELYQYESDFEEMPAVSD